MVHIMMNALPKRVLKLLKRYEATLHHICNSLINSMKEDQFVDQSGTIESKSTKSIKQENSRVLIEFLRT